MTIEFSYPTATAEARNNAVHLLDRLEMWRELLPGAEHGRAIGSRAAVWRRVSEAVEVPG